MRSRLDRQRQVRDIQSDLIRLPSGEGQTAQRVASQVGNRRACGNIQTQRPAARAGGDRDGVGGAGAAHAGDAHAAQAAGGRQAEIAAIDVGRRLVERYGEDDAVGAGWTRIGAGDGSDGRRIDIQQFVRTDVTPGNVVAIAVLGAGDAVLRLIVDRCSGAEGIAPFVDGWAAGVEREVSGCAGECAQVRVLPDDVAVDTVCQVACVGACIFDQIVLGGGNLPGAYAVATSAVGDDGVVQVQPVVVEDAAAHGTAAASSLVIRERAVGDRQRASVGDAAALKSSLVVREGAVGNRQLPPAVVVDAAADISRVVREGAAGDRQCAVIIVDAAAIEESLVVREGAVGDRQCAVEVVDAAADTVKSLIVKEDAVDDR